MSKLEGFSAALIGLALVATPAMAREHHAKAWHDKNGAYVEASHVMHVGGHHCIRAPDVGAFASDPYTKPPCEPASWY
jgi:hypothetical protein